MPRTVPREVAVELAATVVRKATWRRIVINLATCPPLLAATARPRALSAGTALSPRTVSVGIVPFIVLVTD